jgi:hypothetical protein
MIGDPSKIIQAVKLSVSRRLAIGGECGDRGMWGQTGNVGTSMISKSQEETEVSWRLEEKALEAGIRRLS